MQVVPRHALDVVHRDRIDPLAIGLQLFMSSPKNTAFRTCSAIWLGVSIVAESAGQVFLRAAQLALADAVAQQPPISSTISRSVSPVVSDRVLVSATMSPACLRALKSAEAP